LGYLSSSRRNGWAKKSDPPSDKKLRNSLQNSVDPPMLHNRRNWGDGGGGNGGGDGGIMGDLRAKRRSTVDNAPLSFVPTAAAQSHPKSPPSPRSPLDVPHGGGHAGGGGRGSSLPQQADARLPSRSEGECHRAGGLADDERGA
jgi:hypothetical protein